MNESAKRVDKPWGYEIWWARTDRYVGKILHINAGESLSLQYHNVKDETILVQKRYFDHENELLVFAGASQVSARRAEIFHGVYSIRSFESFW